MGPYWVKRAAIQGVAALVFLGSSLVPWQGGHAAEKIVLYQFNQHNLKPIDPIGLPEVTHLLLYADFGQQAQPFETAFAERFRSLAEVCGFAFTMKAVPHATTLSLNPAPQPSDEEMLRAAHDDGASHLLKVKVLEWASLHAPPADPAIPLSEGAFNIEVALRPALGGSDLWHPSYFTVRLEDGGAAFAETLVRSLDKHGAVPGCPPFPKP